MDGFDLKSPLVCEGIVGDGCGGGRLFVVDKNLLFAYDPLTKDKTVLLDDIVDAQQIKKEGCHISIKCKREDIVFDLSSLKKL